jgi:hypothetical protein
MKIVLSLLLMMFSVVSFSQDNDRQLVEKAVLNYVDAFYLADTTLAYKSVVSDLAKRGYYKREGKYSELRMSFPQLTRMASRWKENQNITSESPRKVTLFEVLDKTASAKVEAIWGIDYLHLTKQDGEWKIVNVLWQSYPDNVK